MSTSRRQASAEAWAGNRSIRPPPAAICTSGKTPGGGPCGTGPPKATTLVVQCAHGIRVCQIASEDRLVVADALGTRKDHERGLPGPCWPAWCQRATPAGQVPWTCIEGPPSRRALRSAAPEPELPARNRLAMPSDYDQSGQVPPSTQCERSSDPRALAGTPCKLSVRPLHARQDADVYRAGSRRGALPQHMESGALEVPPTLTVQNDLIWTVLILIGILPVSTQIGGSLRAGEDCGYCT
jgi:hypothetical protein